MCVKVLMYICGVTHLSAVRGFAGLLHQLAQEDAAVYVVVVGVGKLLVIIS